MEPAGSGSEGPPKLKKQKRFSESDIPKDDPKPVSSDKGYKYGTLADDGLSFMDRMQKLAASEEPPVYAGQGADIGKTRGRKPRKSEKGKDKGKRAKTSRKSKKGAAKKEAKKGDKPRGKAMKVVKPKSRSKPVRKLKKTKAGKGKAKNSGASGSSGVAKPRPKSAAQPSSSSLDSDMDPVHHGPKRITPAHITGNHVYTSAYRKNQAKGADFARAAGQLAASTWREEGWVDDLCGVFRSQPRKSQKGQDDGDRKDDVWWCYRGVRSWNVSQA